MYPTNGESKMMRAMILAAGRGSRLAPLTDHTPKPLIKVAGKALIEHQISAIKKAGINDIVINTGWLGQKIMDFLGTGSRHGVQLEYSVEPSLGLETGGGIYQALALLGSDPFLLCNADIYHKIDLREFIDFFHQHSSKTLAQLLLVDKPDYADSGDFELHDGLVLLAENSKHQSYTYSGIGIYNKNLFKNSTAGFYSVVPLLKKAITQKRVNGFYSSMPWFDAGTQDRLETIEKFSA